MISKEQRAQKEVRYMMKGPFQIISNGRKNELSCRTARNPAEGKTISCRPVSDCNLYTNSYDLTHVVQLLCDCGDKSLGITVLSSGTF